MIDSVKIRLITKGVTISYFFIVVFVFRSFFHCVCLFIVLVRLFVCDVFFLFTSFFFISHHYVLST